MSGRNRSGRRDSDSPGSTQRPIAAGLLHEASNEVQRGVGHFSPAAVDGQCVAATGHLYELGYLLLVLRLLLVRGVGDGPGHVVVLLAGDDQQRTACGVLPVDLDLGPRVQVRRCGLEQRFTRCRHGVLPVEPCGFVLADRVGEPVSELVVGERDRPVAVERERQESRICGGLTGRRVWLACRTGVGCGDISSGLAPDVELVGLVDEIGASLSMSDEPPQDRHAQVANSVHVLDDL